MKYAGPPDGTTPDPFINANPGAEVEGSIVSPPAIEQGMRELDHFIGFAGLTPDHGDLTQFAQAVIQRAQAIAGISIGTVIYSAQTLPGPGFLFCNGVLFNIATYPLLFAEIGNTWGGDGITTFATPLLAGYLPVGDGTGPGLSARTLGDTVGEENTTLTLDQIVNHTHTYLRQIGTNNEPKENDRPETRKQRFLDTSLIDGHPFAEGIALPHNTMQPVQVLNPFIKADS